MTSKQKKAKQEQGYRKIPSQCQNCKNFEFSAEVNQFGYAEKKKIRCGIGGFAVQRTAVCDLWVKK